MTERAIPFSGPLVRALLAGTKTQTRRLVRDVPEDAHTFSRCEADGSWIIWCSSAGPSGRDYHAFTQRAYPRGGGVRCPYGVPGDRTRCAIHGGENGEHKAAERRDAEGDPGLAERRLPGPCTCGTRLWVRETWALPDPSDHRTICYRADGDPITTGAPWRPSIYMPRWASRITLEVTEVRVERLQEISEEDAKAEGIEPYRPAEGDEAFTQGPAWNRIGFSHLWDSINEKRAPWSSNPWVWTVSFKRIA